MGIQDQFHVAFKSKNYTHTAVQFLKSIGIAYCEKSVFLPTGVATAFGGPGGPLGRDPAGWRGRGHGEPGRPGGGDAGHGDRGHGLAGTLVPEPDLGLYFFSLGHIFWSTKVLFWGCNIILCLHIVICHGAPVP